MEKLAPVRCPAMKWFDILIEGEDGQPSKTWTLCLNYRALTRIEERTGLDLKKTDEWEKIKSGTTFPTIVWCCLEKFSPDVKLEDVVECLNPEAHAILWNTLYDIMFPGYREAVRKWAAENKDRDASPKEVPVCPTT